MASRILGLLLSLVTTLLAGEVAALVFDLPTGPVLAGEMVLLLAQVAVVLTGPQWNAIGQAFYGSLLASALDPGAPVLACAGPGVVQALEAAGLRPVTRPPATAVVVGLHRGFDFDELDRASAAVRGGARFVATNLDATYPVPGGMIPGSGAIAAAVATAAGRAPEVAGKPERPMADLIRKRFGSRGVVVGDRPSTDGALAVALDWPFALVLSGVTQREARPGGEAIPEPPPPFVAADLAALVPNLAEATTAG